MLYILLKMSYRSECWYTMTLRLSFVDIWIYLNLNQVAVLDGLQDLKEKGFINYDLIDDADCCEPLIKVIISRYKDFKSPLTADMRDKMMIPLLSNLIYDHYLQSDYWQKVRSDILNREGYKCGNCHQNKELHIHHKDNCPRYGEEEYSNLVALCEDCHKEAHAILKCGRNE